MQTRRNDNQLLLTYVLVGSVLLHLLVVPLWVVWLDRQSDHEATPLEAVCNQLAEEDRQPVNRPCRNAPYCPSESDEHIEVSLVEEEPEEPERELAERMQFISAPLDAISEAVPPEDTRYASSKNVSVEEETVARQTGMPGSRPGTGAAMAARSETSRESPSSRRDRRAVPIEVPEVDGDHAEDEDARDGERKPESIDEMLPDFEGERVAAATGQNGRPGSGGGTIDYLKDVSEGQRTITNQKRVSYSDFFERVKLGVVTHWSPISVYRRRDPTGRVYGVEDRLTILKVTLRGDGTLAKLYVERPSGLDFLDDEAVRAMNKAVPFPNPPEGLKGLDGNVSFRFAFQVDVSTRRFRMFRYR